MKKIRQKFDWAFAPSLLLFPVAHVWFGARKTGDISSFTEAANFAVAKLAYFLLGNIADDYFVLQKVRKIAASLVIDLKLALVVCGVPVPPVDLAAIESIRESEIADFLEFASSVCTVVVLLVSTVLTSGMNAPSVVALALCITTAYSVIERLGKNRTIKPASGAITDFQCPRKVATQLSLGYQLDPGFRARKIATDTEQRVQRALVIGVVGVTINLLLKLNGCDFGEGAVRIAYGFGFVIRNIDKFELKKKLGMLSHYLDKLQELEYNHNGKNRPAQQVNTVSIENANFGYVDSLERPEPNPVIRGLSYELTTGQLYYVEAENGVGKSTFLRMLTHNLAGGHIKLNGHDRADFSHETLHRMIAVVHQSSEYTHSFDAQTLDSIKTKDPALVDQLGLVQLFGRSTDQMSGGQKKRVALYATITSDASVLLLDEALSEISAVESQNLPQGWRQRIIDVLVSVAKRKIVVLVGHGLEAHMPAGVRMLSLSSTGFSSKLR